MPKRVAITIAGAVSLGSYEAGVVFELLEALRTHNEQADEANLPDTKIYVDIVTGASAGGMTAAMLAQRLMFDGDSMGNSRQNCEFSNPLYYAWVERVDLKGLAKLQRGEGKLKWHSLLSSDLIEEIGREMLVSWLAGDRPLSGAHAVVERDGEGTAIPLDVGLALTNLNGVDYMLPIEGSDEGGFNYTRSVDQMLFSVEATDRADTAKWQQMTGAAVASGAFPAAFRSQGLEREPGDFGTRLPTPPAEPKAGETYVEWGTSGARQFAYCDGGVLQNQPLGIAKNFVDARVKAAAGRTDAYQIASDRLYVFVSPHAVKPQEQKGLKAEKLTIIEELIGVVRTYVRQAMFHDWITAEGMNSQINVLDTRATQLAKEIVAGNVDTSSLEAASAQLNKLLLAGQPEATIRRLTMQYAQEYAEVLQAKGQAAADAFVGALATLEAAAELGLRDKMKIVAVMADDRTELAGSGISAFVGFFSRKFREHDYWVGRVKTRKYLLRADVKRILGVTKWPMEDDWKANPLKNPTDIAKLPMPLWEALRPGLGWIGWIVWIRIWRWLAVLGVVVLALVLWRWLR
jgi:hypothetical protein